MAQGADRRTFPATVGVLTPRHGPKRTTQ